MQITIQKRNPRRFPTFLWAMLLNGRRQQRVAIRNLSVKGAMLDGARFASVGDSVEIACGDSVVRGQIAWVQGLHSGVEFLEPLMGQTLRNETTGRLRVSVSPRYNRERIAEPELQIAVERRRIELRREG